MAADVPIDYAPGATLQCPPTPCPRLHTPVCDRSPPFACAISSWFPTDLHDNDCNKPIYVRIGGQNTTCLQLTRKPDEPAHGGERIIGGVQKACLTRTPRPASSLLVIVLVSVCSRVGCGIIMPTASICR